MEETKSKDGYWHSDRRPCVCSTCYRLLGAIAYPMTHSFDEAIAMMDQSRGIATRTIDRQASAGLDNPTP